MTIPETPDFRTVGELIAKLQELPPEMPVAVLGADCGGYDVSIHSFGFVSVENGYMVLDHREAEATEGGWLHKVEWYRRDDADNFTNLVSTPK